jgi:hypothetical protein
METFIGLVIILSAVFALIFTVRGEAIIAQLPVVSMVHALQGKWGDVRLDLERVVINKEIWARREHPDPFVEPTRLAYFVTSKVGDITIDNQQSQLTEADKLRPISDLIGVIAYPQDRLTSITHELRLYCGLFPIISTIQIVKKLPTLLKGADEMTFLSKLFCVLQDIGNEPLALLAWVEVALIAAFAARLLSEISNLRKVAAVRKPAKSHTAQK